MTSAYACSDPGIEAQPLSDLLVSHDALLNRIKLCFGADRATFQREVMPLVHGYAGYVHLLPATADNYFCAPGGLLQLGLEAAFFSLQGTDAHIFSGRATISERLELEPRWRVATFIGGLCCELNRVLSHAIVTTADGQQWPAYLGGLANWLAQCSASHYYVRWRAHARESLGLGLFALPHVIPGERLQWLSAGNEIVVPQLLACVGGLPQAREQNALEALVRRSQALVIDRNLLASADRNGTPKVGSHLARYLGDALRRLTATHSAWIPNREKSRLWLGKEGLFLVWPGAAADVLGLLESDQLAGIPKSPQTMLELLLAAGVLVAADDGQQTWRIRPPGAKGPIEAVKLASPAIALAELDPAPEPLTVPLLEPRKPKVADPPDPLACDLDAGLPQGTASATRNTPARAEASSSLGPPMATKARGQQLPLIDAELEAAVLSGSGADAAREHARNEATPRPEHGRPPLRLKAPLRLDPAVRDALAQAVATLNRSPRDTDVCTIAEGIFVPLAEFERHGLLPSLALRALQEAKMLRSADASGSPTLTRDVRGTPTIGLLLDPEHVEGLDPSAFTRAPV
ncbi:MAG: TraI domain-containing protein [Burkholderiaceae bacterium]|nr:TraI domain-containing protein [Burkholderiaceae bacterium]